MTLCSYCAFRVALELKTMHFMETKLDDAQDLVNGVQSLLGEHNLQVLVHGWEQCSL